MADENKTRQPAQIGQYYLLEKIAQGGMAEIFKGLSYDVHGIKKTVCIKKILSHVAASHEFIDSLIDEAKIAVNLVHGNIAQTYDLGKIGDDYFMVMEYVDGKSLSQIHKRCQAMGKLIPVQHLAYFISEVLSGLDYIHRRTDEDGIPLHIVHRDVSPQNIMVSFSGTLKIIDFGIAKSGFRVGATDSGILKGKFAYMSPEQAYGDSIDNRSDIFSVGIILHEMLTGKRLFKGTDSRDTIRNVRAAKTSLPSTSRPEVAEELDRITIKALAKDRRKRYQAAQEMRDDLVKFLHANYPDYRPSEAADFVQNIFKDELEKPRGEEVDSKTPFLIIDRSNSALLDDSQFEITGAVKVPTDMRDFVVEESEEKKDESEEESTDVTGDESSESNVEVSTHDKKAAFLKKAKIVSRTIAAAAFGFAIIAFAIHYSSKPTAEKTNSPAPASFAEMLIVTEPKDAMVTLDGKDAGSGSPVTIRDVEPSTEHIISVSKEGFFSNERRLKLDAGEFLSLSIKLEEKTPVTSEVEIATTPSGATIFLDDRETVLKTPTKVMGLSPKTAHRIGLFLDGHKFWSKEINLKPGQTLALDVSLVKDLGTIFIDSEPKEALVMIDGVPAGQTPITKEGLEPDRVYKIEIWARGYDAQSKEVKISAGKKDELRFVLTKSKESPEQTKPPAEMKPKAEEQIGEENVGE